ncbi:C4-dicarboxylate anaerobic carrier family protein [[Clostridium] bifermentans ATCC 638]|uniref:C4-dicarboxylate anaerobic carrier family protein n=1 Tax=Paraclostridium bifermentans ATCC 638 = DSM 14991 TaxID=1233171 RepID=T4VQ42_PARBF|nr:YfcC family protein [Paraclostridium bifermentans]EQK42802.1 C4-dicarboxylate anaerobic carrier family protein [[Clostridium] bifermentans ATCC 638] [Paraclostridium bifermentans ATCC 638 = DSM 14991]RIZ58476.1 YfcC family protein [Paraclostridium bifermentans]UAG19596.1 YfcC family protein [Paraclostridium bifermentans]
MNKQKRLVIPHTFTIIFLLIVFMAILTWIIPSGQFQRKEIDNRLVVIPNTYEYVKENPQSIDDIFRAPIDGFVDAAEIVGFVLLVGGSFGIVNKTGAIEAGINAVVKKLRGNEIIIIPISMILFSLGGTVFGMAEETLPFYMIFVPLMLTIGYDSLTAVATVFLGAMTGNIASTINPFSVGIAQALAQITPGSGIAFRFLIYIILITISIIFVVFYARKIKKYPNKSIVYDLDLETKEHIQMESANIKEFTPKEIGVLIIFAVGMTMMIFGVLKLGWYISEIAMIFIAIGILSGIIGGLNQETIAISFIEGSKDLISAALAIALARGIVIIAQNGFIIDTMLNSAAGYLQNLPKVVFVNLTLFLEAALAFLIPSSSGLASLTIPVLAPLSDLVGVSVQLIVTAYQFGVGLTNMITPTSGVLMGALALANIPYSKWLRFVMPLIITLFISCMIFLTIGQIIGIK